MIFLHTYGVTSLQCERIVQEYGSDTKRIVQEDPCRLVVDIEGIDSKTANEIALKLGFSTDSNERINAGVFHTMRKFEREDRHTLGTEVTILEEATKLLRLEPTIIRQRIHALDEDKSLYGIQAYDQHQEALGSTYQLPAIAEAERNIAKAIARIVNTASTLPASKIDAAV